VARQAVSLMGRFFEWVQPFFGHLARFRAYQVTEGITRAQARPMLVAQLRSPYRYPGLPFSHQRTDSVITEQSMLRGLPYADAAAWDMEKRSRLAVRQALERGSGR
jgi:hypothetical protein